jgi:hypothetical protein
MRTGPPRSGVRNFPLSFVQRMTGGKAGRILQHAADGQRAPEHLLGIVVVVAVVEHPAQVLLRFRQPHDVAERDAFPETHAERPADVVAGHHLEEADRPLFGQLHQRVPVQRRALLARQRIPQIGLVLGVGDHLQLPRLPREADLGQLLGRQLVRQRIAARDVPEFLLGGEVGIGVLDRAREVGRVLRADREPGAERGGGGRAQAEEGPARGSHFVHPNILPSAGGPLGGIPGPIPRAAWNGRNCSAARRSPILVFRRA